jgi:hypothetical protein
MEVKLKDKSSLPLNDAMVEIPSSKLLDFVCFTANYV